MPNPNVTNSLPPAARQIDLYAQLIDFDTGEVLFEFQFNPEALTFSAAAVYASVPTYGAHTPALEYQHSTKPALLITDVLVDTYSDGRSAQPLLTTLQSLLESRESGTQAPRRVALVWGSRTYAPAVVTSLSWEETMWLGGEPAQLRLSLTLETVRSTEPVQSANPSAPPVSALTARQVEEGVAQADAWVRTSVTQLEPVARSVVSSRRYDIELDALTGISSLVTSTGRRLGSLGEWNGRVFTPSRELSL